MTGQLPADLRERLLCHHVGGTWRVPLSDRLCAVRGADGGPLGQLVAAGHRDIARALAAAHPPRTAPPLAAMASQLAALAPALAALRSCEGAAQPDDPGADLHATLDALAGGIAWQPGHAPPGPVLILGCRQAAPVLLAAAVLAAARCGRAVIVKPAPQAAASGAQLADALARSGLVPGAFALLQGDDITGAALLAAIPEALVVGKPSPRDAVRSAARRSGARLGAIAGVPGGRVVGIARADCDS